MTSRSITAKWALMEMKPSTMLLITLLRVKLIIFMVKIVNVQFTERAQQEPSLAIVVNLE